MTTRLAALIFLLTTLTLSAFSQTLTLHGTIHDTQANAYVEVPFTLPPDTERLTVAFRYTKQDHAVLDLGVRDPDRFRGWSGGNKSTFTIGLSDATPSYLPGPLPSGQWNIILGVANLRPHKTADYTIDISFTKAGAAGGAESFTAAPLRTEPRWYRGDLHMHTAHSDGSCPSQSGKPVPCPLFLTLQSAARQNLDFVAVTDHNTTSHFNDQRELQPFFDQLLLIPGREVTTYSGHANVYGTTSFIPFFLGTPSAPTMNAIFQSAHRLGALTSINHPASPTGEVCMGCGWSPKPFDFRLADAIEAVNGRSPAHVKIWHQQLDAGLRPTAIGGSDNHRALAPPETHDFAGNPTTVVFAPELSVAAILDGIRAGHVFIDLTASRDRLLEVTANGIAHMGDTLTAPAASSIDLAIHVAACEGLRLQILLDGNPTPALSPQPITTADQTLHASLPSDGKQHWLEADIVNETGRLQLLGNPIYLNWHSKP